MELPSDRSINDPHIERFELDEFWIEIGVWDDPQGKYAPRIQAISKSLSSDLCRLGRNAANPVQAREVAVHSPRADWRTHMVNLGRGTVAFRASQWSVGAGVNGGSALPVDEDAGRSTARAYGVVDGKLVQVTIEHSKHVPPPEVLLRCLWDAQVAKLRFHDAVKHSRTVHGVQSESSDTSGEQRDG